MDCRPPKRPIRRTSSASRPADLYPFRNYSTSIRLPGSSITPATCCATASIIRRASRRPPSASGDLSSVSQPIFDPTTGSPFPGNIIPTSRISPIAQGLLNFIPLPNQATGTINQDYRLIYANPTNTQALNTRFNATVTPKDNLAFVFNWQGNNSQNRPVLRLLRYSSGNGFNGTATWRHRLARAVSNRSS